MMALTPGRFQVMPDPDAETLAALKADIAKRGVITPIDIDEDGNILDGHNRYRAWQELGKNEPPPTILRAGLTEAEKFAFARKQNLLRRHLSRDERQRLIADQLKATPSRSDRSIAADFGVDHKTVGAARRRVNETGEIPHPEVASLRSAQGGRPPSDTPEAFTRALLGGAKAVRANAAKVAELPDELKLALFKAGISAGAVVVMGDSQPSAPDPEVQAIWQRFGDLLSRFGWSQDAAGDHIAWLMRHGFTPAEWLGDEGRKYRATFRFREPSEEFMSAWREGGGQ